MNRRAGRHTRRIRCALAPDQTICVVARPRGASRLKPFAQDDGSSRSSSPRPPRAGSSVGLSTSSERILRLSGDPDGCRAAYQGAGPWPHLVLDGVVNPELTTEIATRAGAVPTSSLVRESSRRALKDSLPDIHSLGSTVGRLFDELAAAPFIDFVSHVTGVGGLEADPSLYNAGVFITQPGGWQRVHEDFPRHAESGLWNRVAVLLYCWEWSVGSGGELELWPRDMTPPAKVVTPAPGRLIIFETHSATRHGIAQVAASARPRVVVATRYYSTEPPPIEPSRPGRRAFRRPTERRRDVRPTRSQVQAYLFSRVGRYVGRPPG